MKCRLSAHTSHEYLVLTLLVGLFATISTVSYAQQTDSAKDEPDRAVLVVKDPSQFRILQFTDLHYFSNPVSGREARNEATTKLMKTLVEKLNPHLIMATGDLWPENREGRGEEFMRSVIATFEGLGVPWAYVWGNHDQLPDYTVGHDAFTKAKNSLYRGANSDGNYVIDILDDNHKRVWQLVCLNSHGGGLGKNEQAWLQALSQREPEPVQRLAFFHIPIKQYDDIWTSGAAAGFKGETVCLEQEDGSTLPFLKKLGIKACFCGHDHVNDYAGTIDGIELVYGRATGAGGYGTPRFDKGGKLITVDCSSGHYEWQSVTKDGKMWHPKSGERVDFSEKK